MYMPKTSISSRIQNFLKGSPYNFPIICSNSWGGCCGYNTMPAAHSSSNESQWKWYREFLGASYGSLPYTDKYVPWNSFPITSCPSIVRIPPREHIVQGHLVDFISSQSPKKMWKIMLLSLPRCSFSFQPIIFY